MFLHQKFNYRAERIQEQDIASVLEAYNNAVSKVLYFDTETTGLNTMTDKPFLVAFGFDKNVYTFEVGNENLLRFLEDIMRKAPMVFAHNVQFDYHMLLNLGMNLTGINFADSMAAARLTQYADSLSRLSLEALGTEYVDDTAKFGGKVIRSRMTEINRERKTKLKQAFSDEYPSEAKTFNKVFESYKDRVQFIVSDLDDKFTFIDENYKEANYLDVYLNYPDLMVNYAVDDVVIMIEFLNRAIPTMNQTDPGLVTFKRECSLIQPICEMERVGFKADISYLLSSREKVVKYRDELYELVHSIVGEAITVGQHDVIKRFFEHKYGVFMQSADEKALTYIISNARNEEAKELAKTIIELRTIDKWLSTYIDGKLNSITNGRIHTSINNQGAVSGRVSSNLQQQPKEPLLDRNGNELFHPRKVFLADEDHSLVFIDFSQMELRFQAYYTLLVSDGDKNMCRAFIPFDCESVITGETFNPKDTDHLARWDSGEWMDENGEIWEERDLHAVTTFIAFPQLRNDATHPDFKKLRKLGKMCNFLKNYQGGEKAIVEQMGVDEHTAHTLDQAYYQAFPKVKDYQNWVVKELTLHGFVENLYGRRYYMQDSKWFYKAGNYVIQGGCADLVKSKEIEVSEFLKPYKTKLVLPIHDELVFSVSNDELHLIPKLREIMQDNSSILKWIPMISEIEITHTNWADKEAYHA